VKAAGPGRGRRPGQLNRRDRCAHLKFRRRFPFGGRSGRAELDAHRSARPGGEPCRTGRGVRQSTSSASRDGAGMRAEPGGARADSGHRGRQTPTDSLSPSSHTDRAAGGGGALRTPAHRRVVPFQFVVIWKQGRSSPRRTPWTRGTPRRGLGAGLDGQVAVPAARATCLAGALIIEPSAGCWTGTFTRRHVQHDAVGAAFRGGSTLVISWPKADGFTKVELAFRAQGRRMAAQASSFKQIFFHRRRPTAVGGLMPHDRRGRGPATG